MVEGRLGRLAVSVAVLAAPVLVASEARADLDDIRGPIRVGAGWSNVYRARVLSLSFEDEMSLWKLGSTARGQLVFGMDGVRGPSYTLVDGTTKQRGYLGVTLGTGILARLGEHGPAAVLTATMGPLFEQEELTPHGFGVAARGELFPFYLDIKELVACEHGTVWTFVLSGLHGWVLTRQDWIGADQGTTYAAGLGIELGRNLLVPMMNAIMDLGMCSDEKRRPSDL
jgi:hypothetical protein